MHVSITKVTNLVINRLMQRSHVKSKFSLLSPRVMSNVVLLKIVLNEWIIYAGEAHSKKTQRRLYMHVSLRSDFS